MATNLNDATNTNDVTNTNDYMIIDNSITKIDNDHLESCIVYYNARKKLRQYMVIDNLDNKPKYPKYSYIIMVILVIKNI